MDRVFWENTKTPWETFSHFLTFRFSNISQRLSAHFSGISIVQITFRKMPKPWPATEHAWTSFQRKSTAHLTAPKWLQEKHNPHKRLATPQLTLHHFARSASSFTKNNHSWDVSLAEVLWDLGPGHRYLFNVLWELREILLLSNTGRVALLCEFQHPENREGESG